MTSFTDNLGRVWTLQVNVASIRRVRALCGIDLCAVAEGGTGKPGEPNLLARLSEDPVLLADVLHCLCRPECDARGVSDEEFGAALAGDAVECAADALLEEIADFFPGARRTALRKLLSAGKRVREAAERRLEALLDDPHFEEELLSRMEKSSGSSGNAPESAE